MAHTAANPEPPTASHRRTLALRALTAAIRSLARKGSALTSGLRRLVADVRAAWRDPTIPPPTPHLRDYPIRRRF
jgi:hypothetical protein